MVESGRQPARLLLLILLSVLACAASAASLQDQRKAFKAAFKAAQTGNTAKLKQASKTLAQYPLYPYLLWADLDRRHRQASASEIADFLDQYPDVPVSERLRSRRLRHLAKRGRWQEFIRFYQGSRTAEMRCYALTARRSLGATIQYDDQTQDLWLQGNSQSRACDPVFQHWRQTGQLDHQAYWERAVLAAANGNLGLLRYLKRNVDAARQPVVQNWIDGLSRLDLRGVSHWPDSPEQRQILTEALKRLARKDAKLGFKRWGQIKPAFTWSPEQLQQIEHDLALFYAVEYPPDALVRLKALPPDAVDEQIMEWRVRVAVHQGAWSAVASEILSMNADLQSKDRWRYWLGRALQETGRAEQADSIFRELAGETHFHGFMAADQIGTDYSLCPQPIQSDTAIVASLRNDPAIQRALELRAVDLEQWARVEWRRALRSKPAEVRLAAAELATMEQWHHETIILLSGLSLWKDYEKRFPLAWRQHIEQSAKQHSVPSSLVYGIMRSESALAPDAISSANALGLMQLTLPTANRVASSLGANRQRRADLLKPLVNISLGTAHLAELDQRYAHPVAIMAAYNAGPDAADKWLNGSFPNETDRWIETLPYFETRDYIPRVLAFSTIYSWRQHGKMVRVSNWMSAMNNRPGIKPVAPDVEPVCSQP